MRTLRWQSQDGVGRLTLQRPVELNSLTPAVLDDLEQALDLIESDPALRAVVIEGEGDAFCVGMDQIFLHECFTDVPGVFAPFCARYHRLLRRFEEASVLVLAAVDGLARAGGFELVMACDLVVATSRARVADHHIVFGMIPGAGAVPRTVRKLGNQRARELLLTGRWLHGAEIADFGVACRVVEPDQLGATIAELLGPVGSLSRPCLARMKALINACANLPLPQGLSREFAEFLDYHASEPTSADGFLAWVSR